MGWNFIIFKFIQQSIICQIRLSVIKFNVNIKIIINI